MARGLLRFLLLLAIALAVPVQGFAAASAGVCMSLGHYQDGDAHEGNGHDGAQPAYPADDTPAGNPNCPPCVSCCAAVAIAPALGTALPAAAPAVPEPLAQQFIASGMPERLDRPPLAL